MSQRPCPALRSQALQLGPVGLVRVAGWETFLQQFVDPLRDDGANGVNGVVSIEPLGPQPLERPANGDLVAQRDLVLHHDVNRRMEAGVGQSHPRAPVVLTNELGALPLVQGEPGLGIRRVVWVVAFDVLHGGTWK